MSTLDELAREARACTACPDLPLGPAPVLQVSAQARVLLIGQAPGTKAHLSGRPFTDASGDRLRAWLAITPEIFYDPTKLCILPMGLCYPGRLPKGGDCPPRPLCAPLWHSRFLALMPRIELVLLVGSYAIKHYLGPGLMTDHVRRGRAGKFWPLPHPSWRTGHWERQNPWFTHATLPALRAELCRLTAQ
nr:uracil-DNA glycosylase family protein [Acidocella sp.]